MQVFLSWSGEESKQVALLLKEWIPSVIQAVGDPWVSDADIDKGERWFESITESLVKAEGVGIFCITPANLLSPWMAFEAGALAVADRSRVATFLHGVPNTELKPPLSLFQATASASKEDVLKLLKMLNRRVAIPLKDDRLQRAFDQNWPELISGLKAIKPDQPQMGKKGSSEQAQMEMLESILSTVRRIEKDSFRPPDANLGLPASPGGPRPSAGGGLLEIYPDKEMANGDKFRRWADFLLKSAPSTAENRGRVTVRVPAELWQEYEDERLEEFLKKTLKEKAVSTNPRPSDPTGSSKSKKKD